MNNEKKKIERPVFTAAYIRTLNPALANLLGWQNVGIKLGIPPNSPPHTALEELPDFFEGDGLIRIMLQQRIEILHTFSGFGLLENGELTVWIKHAYHDDILMVYKVLVAEVLLYKKSNDINVLHKIWETFE